MNTHTENPVMDNRRAQTAAIGVLLVALLLAVVDTGQPEGTSSAATAAAHWPATVEAGEDHITTRVLADLLLEAPGDLLIVDLRPADEFVRFHLPGSVNLDLVELLGPQGASVLDGAAGKTVVLVSNGMTHPAQAWVALTQAGRSNVHILEDGLTGFRANELTPPSLRGATTQRRARAREARFAALRARILEMHPSTERYATDPKQLTAPTVVSTRWVGQRVGSPSLVVLDTRPKEEDYLAGHLPGAIWAPVSAMREVREGVADELMKPDALAEVVGAWGIGPETEVVTYGGERLQDATHAVLGLVAIGHQRVAVMEGGYPAWRAARREVSTEVPTPTRVEYSARPGAFDFGVDIDDVIAASEASAQPPILDVRPAKYFEGAKGKEVRGGRIPGSISRPYLEDVVLDAGGVHWRPREDLRAAYEGMGLAPEPSVIVSCRTGHQASQTWFALRYLLGYENVRWFDGSWKAWSLRPELPAEAGPAADTGVSE